MTRLDMLTLASWHAITCLVNCRQNAWHVMTCILPKIYDACHVMTNNNVLTCHDARIIVSSAITPHIVKYPKTSMNTIPNPPLEQHIALLHGGDPVDELEHRDHEDQVPECGDVDMTDQKEQKDDNAGEEKLN
ncbi:DNA excision repair protein ERCC-6-like 2 [Pyrus ussuriensis x Pyrus communis]|uniref:DNA excision repair protein ERCC-6-like 2 n=1 Tax=Pyrus ussuriensis x Pyrus communis TaxID=2448454 RepID=A0A5N5G364_9ROSA|nr:DNA excision repair protein ERCC-6-like 2 [Pyrus ussuriensis x Pyrus communis]